ncbi:MAG: hypothetical protein AMXMBFR84_11780 [Candidatus Hydrogenedentota bacterium]
MRQRLFNEILMARQRVYAVSDPTPLQRIELPFPTEVLLKREDLSPIHAYKWRGAYNAMATLPEPAIREGVVCASAGNHAQGVALAARKLGIHAHIFMPVSTPKMKQVAVIRHGGDAVSVVLTGDTYDDAALEARALADNTGLAYIHPYDDWAVMGGQGTLADEVVMAAGPIDAAYLQIGGGGMAASVACWLKAYYPGIRIVGVEGVDQASMAAAVSAGRPITLDHVDVFCDGTAVKRAGDLTYPMCAELIDEFITVTNEEVCAAIQTLWESKRVIPEPSGAMGLAGVLKHRDRLEGKRVLSVLCGANLDFGQLAWIARHAGIGMATRRYLRLELSEARGSLLEVLEKDLDEVNIIEFQYGKIHAEKAFPVIGIEAPPDAANNALAKLAIHGIPCEDVTSQTDVEFRMVHYEPALFCKPLFITLEFPERAGALRDFLRNASGKANICYFNYAFTGEQVGHALLGFEFESAAERDAFSTFLRNFGWGYREIEAHALSRVL